MATSVNFGRPDALRELAEHGITGTDVYFIELLPLIEMMWADGLVQAIERELLTKFLAQHVANLNTLAGYPALTVEQAQAFADRYLAERPSDDVMATLRRLIPPVRLSSANATANDAHRQRLLRWCLDIGAACVAHYPYGDHDRFSEAEKACFEEIFRALAPAAVAR